MIKFDASQHHIRKAVQEFAKGEFEKEEILRLDEKREYPESLRSKAAELGFIGVHYPEELEGSGMGRFENAIITEELCRADSSVGIGIVSSGHGAECLLVNDKNGLKEKFLPSIALGEARSGLAFIDKEYIGENQHVKTVAVKKNNRWIINGIKSYVFDIGKKGFYIVLCNTKEDNHSVEKESLLLIESDRKGMIIRDMGRKLGINTLPLSEVQFNNVEVPLKNIIGEEGRGHLIIENYMAEYQIQIAAQAAGIARGAFERALFYAKERKQFKRPIASFQTIRQKLSDMYARTETARLFAFEAAQMLDENGIDAGYSAMVKMISTQAAVHVTYESIQIMGGYGYMKEYEVERFYRDAKVLQLTGGANRNLKNMIADRLISRRRS